MKLIQPSVCIIFLFYTMFSSITQTFVNVGSEILQKTGRRVPPDFGSFMVAVGPFMQIFLRPYFGWFNDRHGISLYLILIACMILCLTFFAILGNIFGIICFFVSFSSLLFVIIWIFIFLKFLYMSNSQNTIGIWLSNPIPLFVWFGIACSLGPSCVYPLPAQNVPAHVLPTASGIMFAMRVDFFYLVLSMKWRHMYSSSVALCMNGIEFTASCSFIDM